MALDNAADNLTETDVIKLQIEAWKKSIDVQQHFNDIELRIRNLAVTFLGGVIVATGVALNAGRPNTAVWLLFAAFVTWLVFYFMDGFWYHKLLMGAVKNAQDIESDLNAKIPGVNLTHEISESSKVKILGWETHSTARLNLFYILVAALLFFAMLYFANWYETVPSGTNASASPTASSTPAQSVTARP